MEPELHELNTLEGSLVREHCLTMISNLNTLEVLGVDIDENPN